MVENPGVLIRREVRSLEDDTLQAYAKAVAIMKQRPADNPTSWWYQAAMHGSVEPPRDLYNQCKHGSWYFVVWHRLYLYYFERIVRAAVAEAGGPDDWALPYWNYGIDEAHASIPDAFRNPTEEAGSENPLYVEQRRPEINEGAVLPPQITSDAAALACPGYIGLTEFGGGTAPPERQFWREPGVLERSPHNAVHGAIGGENGWMSFPEEAAKDPIFWLHHCNIDRIWAEWGGQDPTEPAWSNQGFEFFDADGQKVSKTCMEAVDTVQDLGYTYDVIPGIPPQPPTEPEPSEGKVDAAAKWEPAIAGSAGPNGKIVGASEENVTLTGSPEAIPVAIDDRGQKEVLEASRESTPERLYLNIEDIEGEKNPGTVYGVYVNLPEDPDEKTLKEHYAGNISFFGIEHSQDPPGDEHGHGLRYSLEVGSLLRKLGGGEQFGDEEVRVSFRPLPLMPPGGKTEESFRAAVESRRDEPPVKIGRISLAVDA
jgi:tyrosinase